MEAGETVELTGERGGRREKFWSREVELHACGLPLLAINTEAGKWPAGDGKFS